ncbi:hypothetical protein N7449_004019 [Penicillium cf. viridicatum]|uniref:Myb-like DNA-binding domain-containing protein n=1 Tax=Penicillium cf. viridicatum TaxID=2972119 RepID=A0A9W9MYG5_9EURO|nr:hypothetical protein N7449_004019 [Penicillium cf. viridicatum]
MTPRNTPQPKKAPTKGGRDAASFDRNHEFLLHCLTLSGVRIDYAAVAKCEGTSVKQAQWHFWWLKTNISSQENATPGADTETEQGRAQKDKQEGNDAKENN